ncbi:GNAT family N-acetyltransferase [Candidatus Lokiarchaeum ossiferum]|uniref:GNAT family N-acetyltransferase n=1 Tax=Candidatus Lokiarchaeum ossiferum TaxID=2951803 RepID=UPI00352CF3E1
MSIQLETDKMEILPINLTEDLPKLTEVMKRAFNDDARRFNNKPEGDGPPGYDDGNFYRKWSPQSNGFKIVFQNKIVGAILVFPNSKGKSYLGNINIDPQYQNLGFGTKLIQFIERKFPLSKLWVLDTPSWATRNHHFYQKNGYSKTKEVMHNKSMKSFVFEKRIE